ncbi:MAG: glutaredoxin 3 [Pseudomonadales bacterium]|nr:glutaredoxin 3 [Pseudomonadales bacterium]
MSVSQKGLIEKNDLGDTKVKNVKAKIVMYSTRFCPFCIRAKMLLNQKGVQIDEKAVDFKPALRQEMMAKSGQRTVPQIWIGETHVGGCDELFMLEREGRLDRLLNQI